MIGDLKKLLVYDKLKEVESLNFNYYFDPIIFKIIRLKIKEN